MNASILAWVSGSCWRRAGCAMANSSRAVVRIPSMVLSVPRCAGISKSIVGKVIVQESDLMMRLFRSCCVDTVNRYFTPCGWISPAFWISEFAKPGH